MNIIEKLGITPGPWSNNGLDVITGEIGIIFEDNSQECERSVCRRPVGHLSKIDNWMHNGEFIAAAPEMLEALIEYYRDYEHAHESGMDWPIYHSERMRVIIEKATGKSWEEIKELL